MNGPAHSEWSASKFEQLMLCPGSRAMQRGLPRQSSRYSTEGLAAHQLLEMVLRSGTPAAGFVGRVLVADGDEHIVDDEMAEHVQWAADRILELKADGALLIEQRAHYHDALGLPPGEAWGTADAVILRDNGVLVIDFKYGRGVEVSPETPQIKLYALGTIAEHDGIAADLEGAALVILQPRVSRTIAMHTTSVADLRQWADVIGRRAVEIVQAAEEAHGGPDFERFLRPSEDACRFCLAKQKCPALRREVAATVSAPASADEFDEVVDPKTLAEPDLARAMRAVDLIEDWCLAVRGEVERRLLDGTDVPGFKLVEGKAGNRAWTDPKAVEAMLREQFRLPIDQAYDLKLISPTTAEKRLAKESPRRWQKLQPLIMRMKGKPSVAPVSDKRPAIDIKPVADEFAALPETSDLV